jgi:hypothetical protein
MRSLLPFLLFAASGCATAAQESPRTADPFQPAHDSDRVEWRLHIDTKGRGIGAFTISIQWNAGVATIAEIVPCSPKHYKGQLMYEDAALASGLLRITSFDTSGTSPRSGEWHLFTVIFQRVGPGALAAKADLQKLYDAQSKPLNGRLADAVFRATFP